MNRIMIIQSIMIQIYMLFELWIWALELFYGSFIHQIVHLYKMNTYMVQSFTNYPNQVDIKNS